MCHKCTALGRAVTALYGQQRVPVHVQGDGNCLFHAVSRALIGFETLYHVLRTKVFQELRDNRAWYVEHTFFGSAELFDSDIARAELSGVWAPVTHLVALATVIKRPIALLCSLADMRGSAEAAGCAVYLPARHAAAECCSNPLLLAWSSGEHNHYVPLCRNKAAGHPAAPTLPAACRPQRGVPPGFNVEAYIPVGCWCLTGTRVEQLPANALVQAGQYERFQQRLVERATQHAIGALNALQPVEAVTALTADSFMSDAQADTGLLALSACISLEATRRYCLLSTGERDAFMDGVCAVQFDALARGVASPVSRAALHVGLLKEIRLKLCELLATMQTHASALPTAGLRINIGLVEEALDAAEADLDLALLRATFAAVSDAMQQEQPRLQRTPSAAVSTQELLQRVVAHAYSPPPRFVPPPRVDGCVARDAPSTQRAALTRCSSTATVAAVTAAHPMQPLRSTTSWPTGEPAGAGATGAGPAGEAHGMALGPAKSAPAGMLKRLFSASEQAAAATESVVEKRLRALQRQGSNVDARTPMAELFELPPPPPRGGDAANEAEAAPVTLPEPTADDEDAETRDLHAALLLSMMPADNCKAPPPGDDNQKDHDSRC